MNITSITRNIFQHFKIKNNPMMLHRWGNHTTPNSDCFYRMESCMAMKWNDYHNVPSINEKLVDKRKTTKEELSNVSNPDVVMMRMTMLF